MKTLFFIIFFACITLSAFAQNQFTTAMSGVVAELQKAKTLAELQATVNKLERIANSETREYLPHYYAAQSFIQMSFLEKEAAKKDQILDQAQQHLDQALTLQPNESEIFALQGFLHQARIQVDFMNRGSQYAPLAMQALEKAKNLNPENPRAYLLMGQNLFYTPAMFGGGPASALPLLTQAQQKFTQYKPATAISPNWGSDISTYLFEKCQTEIASGK